MKKKEPIKNGKPQNEKKEFTTWDCEEMVKKDQKEIRKGNVNKDL